MFDANAIYKQNSARFRRWSRKSYAIFASLHKAVTIGQLIVSICDKSLEKLRNRIFEASFNDLFNNNNEEDENELLSTTLEIQILTAINASSDIAQQPLFTKNIHPKSDCISTN